MKKYLQQCFSPSNTTTTTTVSTNTVTKYSTAQANTTAVTNTTTTTTTKNKSGLTNNTSSTSADTPRSRRRRSNNSSNNYLTNDEKAYLPPPPKKDNYYHDHHHHHNDVDDDDQESSSTEDQLDYYPNPSVYPNPNAITYPTSNHDNQQYPNSNSSYSNPPNQSASYSNQNPNPNTSSCSNPNQSSYSNPNPNPNTNYYSNRKTNNQYPDSDSNRKSTNQKGNPTPPEQQQQTSKDVVIGTFYGHRRGHICFCIQNDRLSTRPTVLLELSIPTDDLVKEMEREVVRIVLECDTSSSNSSVTLLSIPIWTMYINGRSVGFAAKKKATDKDRMVMKTMQSTTVGAGVIPEDLASSDKAGELIFMRANYKRVVGGPDSESFHLTNPDGCLTQELSVFLMRSAR